jgi:adenosylhomocysteine nucleosidase
MRPGILAATPAEARTLKKGAIQTGCVIYLPRFLLIVSGMGPGRAANAAESLAEAGAQGLVSWGTAAALIPGLSPGTLVFPEKILSSAGSVFTPDPGWQEALRRRLAGVASAEGILAETPAVLARGEEKSALFRTTGAIAADMESAAVARVARERKMPFLAVRVIMDEGKSDISGGILQAIDEFGRLRLPGLLKLLAGNPGELAAVVRMGRAFHAARRTLMRVSCQAGEALQFPGG